MGSCLVLQSLLVSILSGVGALATTEDQKNLQNFLICVEMLPAAVGMLFAFPYHEYKGTGEQAPPVVVNIACKLEQSCSSGHLSMYNWEYLQKRNWKWWPSCYRRSERNEECSGMKC